jgi:hypothetical protein
VKALVEAGSDIGAKNDAGHDAVFLAERTGWATEGQGAEKEGDEGESADDGSGKMTKGREVVEWLLGCENGAGLESGVDDRSSNGDEGDEESEDITVAEGMEGFEETAANEEPKG